MKGFIGRSTYIQPQLLLLCRGLQHAMGLVDQRNLNALLGFAYQPKTAMLSATLVFQLLIFA